MPPSILVWGILAPDLLGDRLSSRTLLLVLLVLPLDARVRADAGGVAKCDQMLQQHGDGD